MSFVDVPSPKGLSKLSCALISTIVAKFVVKDRNIYLFSLCF